MKPKTLPSLKPSPSPETLLFSRPPPLFKLRRLTSLIDLNPHFDLLDQSTPNTTHPLLLAACTGFSVRASDFWAGYGGFPFFPRVGKDGGGFRLPLLPLWSLQPLLVSLCVLRGCSRKLIWDPGLPKRPANGGCRVEQADANLVFDDKIDQSSRSGRPWRRLLRLLAARVLQICWSGFVLGHWKGRSCGGLLSSFMASGGSFFGGTCQRLRLRFHSLLFPLNAYSPDLVICKDSWIVNYPSMEIGKGGIRNYQNLGSLLGEAPAVNQKLPEKNSTTRTTYFGQQQNK